MNISQYIDSGILEEFVLGLVDTKEEQEVLKRSEKYPEIKTEIEKIEIGLAAFALALAAPPPYIKPVVLEKIEILN